MKFLPSLLALLFSFAASAQYTPSAGTSAPKADRVEEVRRDAKGVEKKVWVEKAVVRDSYGNAGSVQHDLAVDGAFEGQTVAVIQLYTGSDLGFPFDFAKPKEALKQKGFSVYRWMDRAPSPKELEAKLEKASQLWVISGAAPQLTAEHVAVIKRFFDSGRGLYLWGDNQPYSSDANVVAEAIFGTKLQDFGHWGEKVVGLHRKGNEPGVIQDHLLTTGLEYVYEGHTTTSLANLGPFKPLIYGSDGKVTAGFYDQNGKRAIMDGGFTRLYLKWDTAGTGRYVKNAAAWLANAERFGSQVVASSKKTAPKQ